jgi:hypothetical protein
MYLIKKLVHTWICYMVKHASTNPPGKLNRGGKHCTLLWIFPSYDLPSWCHCVVAVATTKAYGKGAEAMSNRFETIEERRWRFGLPARREGEMGAERFEMARRGVEGRGGTGVGVIYPIRWRALSDYQYTLSLWWWLKQGALGRGKQKGHLTTALPGHPKFQIFEWHTSLLWGLVSAIY